MPNHGTAMGPCHACDYVDVFMGFLDEKTVKDSPVPLLSSLISSTADTSTHSLDWSRFRDDGITFLLDPNHVNSFENHLQNLHPDMGSELRYIYELSKLNSETN